MSDATAADGWGGLPCPRCGEAEATIVLDLADLDRCVCAECEAEFTVDEVRAIINRWSGVIRWIELVSPRTKTP